MRGVSAFFSTIWAAVCSLIWPDLKQLTVPQLAKRFSSRFSFISLSPLRELHRRLTVAQPGCQKDIIYAVVDAIDALPVLVLLLKSHWLPSVQLEAARCLAAIAFIRLPFAITADALIKAGAIPAFVHLLSSPHELGVRVHAASALCSVVCSVDYSRSRPPDGGGQLIYSRKGLVDGVNMTSLLGVISEGLKSGDGAIQLAPASALRDLLREAPPIQEAIDAGLIQPVVAVLANSVRPKLQFEAAWALTYIASGTSKQTQAVVDAGGIPPLIQLLSSSPHLDERVYVASALCRIATSRQRVVEGVSLACLLGVISDGLKSGDTAIQLEAAAAVGRLLAIEEVPPTQEAVDAGVVQPLVGLLSDSSMPKVQYEAMWSLTNIAGGTSGQTQAVVEAGAIPPFVQLLSSPYDGVREPAVWALGNIAGDRQHRDLVLEAGVMEPLLKVLRESKEVSMVGTATWTLSNLCRGRPQPLFELVSPAVPVVAELIKRPDQDAEVLRQGCRVLSHFTSERGDERIEAVVGSGVCGRLVELVGHDSCEIQQPAVRTIGNIVAGNDVQKQAIIECGAIPALRALLSSPNENIRKEACWTFSNIMAGSREQRQREQRQVVIESGGVPLLITIATTDTPGVKREALWAIINGVGLGSQQQVEYLVECGCVGPLCDLLVDGTEVAMLRDALLVVHNLLRLDEDVQARDGLPHNPYCNLIRQADGVARLSQLTHHADENIRTLSVALEAMMVEAMEAMMVEDDTDVGSEGTDTECFSDGKDGNE
ncbi:unnamed protein product [Vitrella brassicaformis CCMP3155]|uniref:Importin subunit alpha n=1 Tax=Vitrella brassicaformis (strain CCMP3155) TaxID=1169540 RepID=A0A0G4GHM3_VITBC|nr:unnamed protein product [Vitrella brassicaformis CCMP3155]|eukprot:CEM29194.1 unnamed protein product [Vitrella brassicaformis CCMP3155]